MYTPKKKKRKRVGCQASKSCSNGESKAPQVCDGWTISNLLLPLLLLLLLLLTCIPLSLIICIMRGQSFLPFSTFKSSFEWAGFLFRPCTARAFRENAKKNRSKNGWREKEVDPHSPPLARERWWRYPILLHPCVHLHFCSPFFGSFSSSQYG